MAKAEDHKEIPERCCSHIEKSNKVEKYIIVGFFFRLRVILVPVVPSPKNLKDLIDSYDGNVEVSHFLFATCRHVRDREREKDCCSYR